jgi:hypothetical protein
MNGAASGTLDPGSVDALDDDAVLSRKRNGLFETPIAARADPQPPHTSGAERFEDGFDAVDDH